MLTKSAALSQDAKQEPNAALPVRCHRCGGWSLSAQYDDDRVRWICGFVWHRPRRPEALLALGRELMEA